MGMELYWDDDARTVMLLEVRGSWTWDELYATVTKIKKVTDNADREIGAILDLSEGLKLPGGGFLNKEAYNMAQKLLKLGEGGTGPVVVVGVNPVIRAIYTTFYPMDKQALGNVRFAGTVDEARDLLAARQPGGSTVSPAAHTMPRPTG